MAAEVEPNDLASFMDGGTGNVPEDQQLDTSKAEEQARQEKVKADAKEEYDQRVKAEALRVYESGDVYDYIIASCEKRHVCSSDIERNCLGILILSCGSMQVSNCCGMYPYLPGNFGGGKSDCAKTVAKHYPDDYVLKGYTSKTALQHMTDLKPMTLIIRDDQSMNGDAADTFNASTSEWDEDYLMYITSPINHEVKPLTIPRRCSRWTIYADGTGNDQNHDRQIVIHVDSSTKQKKCVHDKMAYDSMHPLETLDNFTVDVSKEIWSIFMKDAPYLVEIPFGDDIVCDEGENNRAYSQMLCMVKCFTLLAKEKREKYRSPDGTREIIVSSIDDYHRAARIMNKLIQGEGGSQKHKLTPTGEKVLDFLMHPDEKNPFKDCKRISFIDLKSYLGISSSNLSKAINGGLLDIVGISVDNEGSIDTPHAKAFVIDRDAFNDWEGSHGLFVLKRDEKLEDWLFIQVPEEEPATV